MLQLYSWIENITTQFCKRNTRKTQIKRSRNKVQKTHKNRCMNERTRWWWWWWWWLSTGCGHDKLSEAVCNSDVLRETYMKVQSYGGMETCRL